MLLLGIDIGTSFIKVSVINAATGKCIHSAQYPETESPIISSQPGWAEQNPDTWWENVRSAILKSHSQKNYDPHDIIAIGIAYQMHGLVCVDRDQQVLRDSIIWCDSRAVDIGHKAFGDIGREKCLRHLLNSPGNFTASKLAWVKQNEPAIYNKIDTVMLPGDFIAMKLTGHISTSISALSEGIFWDFEQYELSKAIFEYFGLSTSVIPEVKDVFSEHGRVIASVATDLSLKEGIPVSYKAGDQLNNAFSLQVMEPGEVAATAGTSGAIYAVSDQLTSDCESRVNSFAHVNHSADQKRIGVLLNINGAGILNRWVKNITGDHSNYRQIDEIAGTVSPGSDGLFILPFGNGAERMLNNKTLDAHIHHINFNIHHTAHIYRAAQEGIVFAFRYGLDIMRANGIHPSVIRASKANMFLSDVFTEAFVNATNTAVELYEGDGSVGAAIGAGLGAGIYKNIPEAFGQVSPIQKLVPQQASLYNGIYENWKKILLKQLNQ